jgi:predicted dinucleotide-binding enzyme
MELARSIGLQAYDAGSLLLSSTVESLTPMLIGMNHRYGSKHIGIQLTGF